MRPIIYGLLTTCLALAAFRLAGDGSYNCHNYAWEDERRWLNDPTPFVMAATECPPEDATHIVYYDGDTPIHSGLYLGDGWVRSKWGANPLMTHPWYLSTYGYDVKYYR